MRVEDELRLSFYKEIASLNEHHGVKLVQHTETGKVFVKKTLTHYDPEIFLRLQRGHFAGIPVIRELVPSGDGLIVIEDFISGHSVEEMLQEGTFTVQETIAVITALCDILMPLHEAVPRVIHRDIKPSNVLIDNDGLVWLIDFDASKVVIEGRKRDTELIGTVDYAAPEQYGFGQSDQRTDIYALGILMNRMLTGKLPSESLYDGDLALVIQKAASLDPANRYQTVRELRKALANPSQEGSVGLKRFLSRLPRPIRELPGFRSGRPLNFAAAVIWYVGIVLFAIERHLESDFPRAQSLCLMVMVFLVLIMPTLYLGNYFGVRDRFPWRRSDNKVIEVLRIALGAAAAFFLTFWAGMVLLALIFPEPI